MARPSLARRGRIWTIGAWVWLLVGILNIVIVGLRLAAGWPPRNTDLIVILISSFTVAISFALYRLYRRKADEVVTGHGRDG